MLKTNSTSARRSSKKRTNKRVTKRTLTSKSWPKRASLLQRKALFIHFFFIHLIKSNLYTAVFRLADKEGLLRDLKRQNIHLKTKIKYLEDEMNSLNEKVDSTIRERNKLRKEIQINLATSLPIENLSDSLKTNQIRTRSPSKGHQSNRTIELKGLAEPPTGSTIAMNGKNMTRSFRSASFNYWNDLNATSSWDVNYNTGYLSKYNRDQLSMSSKTLNTLNGPLKDLTYTSMATDLNSVQNMSFLMS